MNWNNYYANQSGGGFDYSIFRGTYMQRGYGLGGTFRNFFKWITPIFKQHALPLIQSGAQELGKQAISTGVKLARDAVSGKNIKDSAKEHVTSAVENLKGQVDQKLSSVQNKLEGKGIKRKRMSKKFIILKKQKKNYSDIFS